MQGFRERCRWGQLRRANFKPRGKRADSSTDFLWSLCIGQFSVHCGRHKNFLEKSSEQIFLVNSDQVPKRCSVGDGNHAAEQLSREATCRRFKQGRLAIEIGFADLAKGNLMLPQEILRLHTGQP